MSWPARPAEERFWAKVDKTDNCWTWTAAKNQKGYGLFTVVARGKTISAHRYAYQLTRGELAQSELLDHICRNPSCVNPSHLRKVTTAQNAQHQVGHRDSKSGHRGVGWNARRKKWQVSACHNGKHYHGGLFTDLNEAAEAARQLRLSLFTHNDLDRKEIPA